MMIELFSMLAACGRGEAGEFLRFLQGFPDDCAPGLVVKPITFFTENGTDP
jgi:hypothetical protein